MLGILWFSVTVWEMSLKNICPITVFRRSAAFEMSRAQSRPIPHPLHLLWGFTSCIYLKKIEKIVYLLHAAFRCSISHHASTDSRIVSKALPLLPPSLLPSLPLQQRCVQGCFQGDEVLPPLRPSVPLALYSFLPLSAIING